MSKPYLTLPTICWMYYYRLQINWVKKIPLAVFNNISLIMSITNDYDWLHLHMDKKNSVTWVCERTIPTERAPLFGEVSANFCGQRVSRGQRDVSLLPYSRLSRPEPLLFLPSSSSDVFTRLSRPRSRPTTSRKIWQRRESNPDL
jgi:hypothetical protein